MSISGFGIGNKNGEWSRLVRQFGRVEFCSRRGYREGECAMVTIGGVHRVCLRICCDGGCYVDRAE
jgi:hypothetical protein